MKRQKITSISIPTSTPLPSTANTPCPLCKITLDNDITYSGYRRGEAYKAGKYPPWAYPEGGDLPAHLMNFHRMPKEFSTMFAVGLAMGFFIFLKENPQFKLMLPIAAGVTVTNTADHPEPIDVKKP